MKPLSETSVTIVGLGLMGGSLAMALKPHVKAIQAIDTDQVTLDLAVNMGIVDRSAISLSGQTVTTDLVVLATPVRTIIELTHQLPEKFAQGCDVMDLGSTKLEIVRAMSALPDEFHTLGGHPMCGREISGFEAATDDLYREKTFVLCPTESTTPVLIERAHQIIEAIGAKPLHMTADLHDSMVGVTSHLPYILSALLMNQASDVAASDERLWSVTASGFRDTSRLSGSDPSMMVDILMTNRTNIIEQLARHRTMVKELEDLLLDDEDSTIKTLLDAVYEAHKNYQRFLRSQTTTRVINNTGHTHTRSTAS